MKRVQLFLFPSLIGLSLIGCASSDTPQASAQLKSQFAGGPMPADARQKFEESMKKSNAQAQQRPQNGGK